VRYTPHAERADALFNCILADVLDLGPSARA